MTMPAQETPALDPQTRELLFEEAVLAYLAQKQSGPVDKQALERRYAPVAAELAAFFAAEEAVGAVLSPPSSRQPAGDTPGYCCSAGRDAEGTLPPFGKYADFAFINRGGMGTVYRCRDRELGRSLAMKVMHSDLAQHPDYVLDFQEEAQVASQLTHPNIPPIHERGALPDGRPYFTMKLVEGRTLTVLIGEYHASPTALRFDALLHHFVGVCNALAHAHQSRVLHRDLKPDNVMVGAFGEVQVMDWGLSKVVRRVLASGPAPRQETMKAVWTGGCEQETEQGLIRGTFAYMPPEQAEPGSRTLDERCDIFALGAMLCEMLTGAPPYTSAQAQKHLRQQELWEAARACATGPAFARLDANAGRKPAELVALAKKCLAKEPGARPSSATVVAEGVTRYLAGVQEAKVRAERRAKWLTAGLGLVATLVLAAGGGLWYKLDRDARRTEAEARQREEQWQQQATAADVTAAVAEMYAALSQDQFAAARAALERAKGRLGTTAPPELREDLSMARRNFEAALALDEIRQEREFRAIEPNLGAVFAHRRVGSAAPVLAKYARQFAALGYDPARPGTPAQLRASPIRRALLTALDDWATHEPDPKLQLRLWAVAREADPDPPWGDRFRDPAIRKDPATLARLAADASLHQLTLAQIMALVEALPYQDPNALRLLRAAEIRYPADFWVNMANVRRLVHTPAGSLEAVRLLCRETIGYARAAAAIRPDSFVALVGLGYLYAKENNPEEVEKIAHRLPQSGRVSAIKRFLLAMAATGRRKHQEAIAHLTDALRLEPDDAVIELELAKCYALVGNHDRCLRLVEQVLARHPQHGDALTVKALSRLVSGRLDEAEKLSRAVLERDPRNSQARELFAVLLLRQGRLLDLENVLKGLAAEEREQGGGALGAGLCLYVRGDLKESERVLREACGLTGSVDLELALCLALVGSGRFAEAKSALDAARRTLRGIDYTQFPVLGITLNIATWNGTVHLKNFMQWDGMNGNQPPKLEYDRIARIPLGPLLVGDYCLAKRYYVSAARCYALGLPEKSWHGRMNYVVLLPGTNRIKAARAAAQAMTGGGHESGQAKDAERERFRTLALRWLKEEVDDCLQAIGRNGSLPDVNLRIHFLKMHPELDPVRNSALIREMPADDRKRAEAIWTGVEEVYRKLNPPVDLPWAKKEPMAMR